MVLVVRGIRQSNLDAVTNGLPRPLSAPLLLPFVALGFGGIGEVGIDFQFESHLGGPAGVIGQCYFFVEAVAHETG
jgi:hypothetical protein